MGTIKDMTEQRRREHTIINKTEQDTIIKHNMGSEMDDRDYWESPPLKIKKLKSLDSHFEKKWETVYFGQAFPYIFCVPACLI